MKNLTTKASLCIFNVYYRTCMHHKIDISYKFHSSILQNGMYIRSRRDRISECTIHYLKNSIHWFPKHLHGFHFLLYFHGWDFHSLKCLHKTKVKNACPSLFTHTAAVSIMTTNAFELPKWNIKKSSMATICTSNCPSHACMCV